MTQFDGSDEAGASLDGEVGSALLGVDWASADWTLGVALAHSRGEGAHEDARRPFDVEASLTGFYPYAGLRLDERTSFWAAAGYGAGEFEIERSQGAKLEADLEMTMGALGLRSALLESDGGASLTARADGRFTRASSDASENGAGERLASTSADVWMLRAGLEAGRSIPLSDDGAASVTPALELGLRVDGGDAETGYGADVGGSLTVASGSGLSLELALRGLAAHEESDFSEWGASAGLSWAPRLATGTGPSFSLRQAWGGGAAFGGMDALLGDSLRSAGEDLAGYQPDGGRLEAELAYGLARLGGRLRAAPYAGIAMDQGARDLRLGWWLNWRPPEEAGLDLRLETSRRQAAGRDGREFEYGVSMRALLRW